MRPRITAVLGLALLACTARTDAGPIGQALDLRQYLPDSLRTNAGDDSTFRKQMRLGSDSAPVEMTWTTFRHGSGQYLGTVTARLVAAARYDSLTVGEVSSLRNVGTKFVPTEGAKVRVSWFGRRFFRPVHGSTTFGFDAAGRHTIEPDLATPSR